MSMTFSNAAIRSSDVESIVKIAKEVTPHDFNYRFSSFYIHGPFDGWCSIYAPEEHPANSFSLAIAISKQLSVAGFAGFVSQSDKIGVRLFDNGKTIYSFMNHHGEFQQDGDLDEMKKIFLPNTTQDDKDLHSLFSKDKYTWAENLYLDIVKLLRLPLELGEHGWGSLRKLDEEGELDEDFGKNHKPRLVMMNGYDN